MATLTISTIWRLNTLMKKTYLVNSPILMFTLLMGICHTSIAAALTFTSIPSNPVLISETDGPFNGTVNYTPLKDVTSAKLTIFLSDDPSSFFSPPPPASPVIDSPREWASLTSVTDGGLEAIIGASVDVEVDPQLFVAPHPTPDVATAAGIENPGVPPESPVLPTTAPYFNLDVTNLIQNSNSGAINFTLAALSLYPTIQPSTQAHDLILADAATLGITLPPNVPFPVNEDFFFNQAQLTVEGVVIPTPSAIGLMAFGLFGMLFINRIKSDSCSSETGSAVIST